MDAAVNEYHSLVCWKGFADMVVLGRSDHLPTALSSEKFVLKAVAHCIFNYY